jgi:hypothetical protein
MLKVTAQIGYAIFKAIRFVIESCPCAAPGKKIVLCVYVLYHYEKNTLSEI